MHTQISLLYLFNFMESDETSKYIRLKVMHLIKNHFARLTFTDLPVYVLYI